MTCSNPVRLVSSRNRAGSIVSRLTLIRRRPASCSSFAIERQQDAVGREPDVLDPRDRDELLDELRQVAAHQRLAAGQPDLVDPHRARRAGEAGDLLEAQQARPRQEFDRLGHAVDAADIAAVGDADPQVIVDPAKAVDQAVGIGHGWTRPIPYLVDDPHSSRTTRQSPSASPPRLHLRVRHGTLGIRWLDRRCRPRKGRGSNSWPPIPRSRSGRIPRSARPASGDVLVGPDAFYFIRMKGLVSPSDAGDPAAWTPEQRMTGKAILWLGRKTLASGLAEVERLDPEEAVLSSKANFKVRLDEIESSRSTPRPPWGKETSSPAGRSRFEVGNCPRISSRTRRAWPP